MNRNIHQPGSFYKINQRLASIKNIAIHGGYTDSHPTTIKVRYHRQPFMGAPKQTINFGQTIIGHGPIQDGDDPMITQRSSSTLTHEISGCLTTLCGQTAPSDTVNNLSIITFKKDDHFALTTHSTPCRHQIQQVFLNSDQQLTRNRAP